MRRALGALALALALPPCASAGSIFVIDGHGWGHGVGMSQWGAEGYARHGYGYGRILAHYYPHTVSRVVRPRPVRVLLANGVTGVRVGSPMPFRVRDARGRAFRLAPHGYVLDVRLRLRAGGKLRALRPPLRFEPGVAPVTLGGKGYRGAIVLIRRGGRLTAVNRLPLDRYLRAVVPREMPRHWHIQAYEAQAVVARSYALATIRPGRDFDLFSDTRSQVYGGIAAETRETNLAIGATAGHVLTYRGHVIAAYYHSTSGGRTSSSLDAWHTAKPYLVSVRDPFDAISPHHHWVEAVTAAELAAKLHVPGLRDVRAQTNASGRVVSLRAFGSGGSRPVTTDEFRSAFGLRSSFFELRVLSLDAPKAAARRGKPVELTGFVRRLARVRVQERLSNGSWKPVALVHPASNGRFRAVVRPQFTTAFRLAAARQPGPEVVVRVR